MDEAVFFTELPSEIIFDIFVRLPIKTIIVCKCVCKSWLKMLETPEFAHYHRNLSIPSLIVFEDRGCYQAPFTKKDEHRFSFKIWECVDELEIEQHELHYNLVAELIRGGFKCALNNRSIVIHSSANGLLFLKYIFLNHITYICNPITREYIEIPLPEIANKMPEIYHIEYGFGLSKTSGQYKVVTILEEFDALNTYDSFTKPSIIKTSCEIYTLGTGSWRSVALECSKQHIFRKSGVFFNGNLHWLVNDNNDDSLWIYCFDLGTELFNMFSGPLPSDIITDEQTWRLKLVVISQDNLHLCYNTDEEVFIWVMMEYGVNKSWRHVITINREPYGVVYYEFLDAYPIKVFKNGDILMSWNDLVEYFGYYSSKSKSLEGFRKLGSHAAVNYIPSLVSLKCFDMEIVSKF